MIVLNDQLAEFLKVDLPVLLGTMGQRQHPRAAAQGAVLPPGPASVMCQGGHLRALQHASAWHIPCFNVCAFVCMHVHAWVHLHACVLCRCCVCMYVCCTCTCECTNAHTYVLCMCVLCVVCACVCVHMCGCSMAVGGVTWPTDEKKQLSIFIITMLGKHMCSG